MADLRAPTVVHLALPRHRIRPGATVSVSVPCCGRRRFALPEGVLPGSSVPLPAVGDGPGAVVVIDLLDVRQRVSRD
jgi:hypothetical protein